MKAKPTKTKPAPKKTKAKTALKPVLATLLLDESGSMASRKGETISAFNEFVDTLHDKVRADKNHRIFLTLVTFNSAKRKTHYVSTPIADVPQLTQNNYTPAEVTPLYDAIGATILQAHGANSQKGNAYDMLFIILTDGLENASQEFNRERIFKAIDQKKKAGWTFVFLGADQDSWAAHADFGIHPGATMNYQGSISTAMKEVAKGTVSYTMNTGGQRVNCGRAFFAGTTTDAATSPDEETS